jgi:hypothetical protein
VHRAGGPDLLAEDGALQDDSRIHVLCRRPLCDQEIASKEQKKKDDQNNGRK